MSEQTQILPDGTIQIAPRTGTAFHLKKGQRLTVIDPTGVQVSDLVAFAADDTRFRDETHFSPLFCAQQRQREALSNGRTFDYADKIYLTTGDALYSNRSNVMLRIVADTVGTHDFLLTPCSRDTFRIIYGDTDPAPGCFGNLAYVLAKYGVEEDQIPCPFNCFMNVPVDGKTGKFSVEPPVSKAGDHIDFVAEMDLVVGLTACSAAKSNGGSFKPIQYRID